MSYNEKPPPPPPPDSSWCSLAQELGLTWQLVGSGLGRLVDASGAPYHLYASRGGAGGPVMGFSTVLWADRVPRLMSEATSVIALTGSPLAETPLVMDGADRYRMDLVASGGTPVVLAVLV